MALLENGQVYGWGENGDGQLGLGRETHCERSPCHVTELNGVKKLVCGTYHTLALTTAGRIYAFGFNELVIHLFGVYQATLIEGGGVFLKYRPQRKILKIHPLKILGEIFEK